MKFRFRKQNEFIKANLLPSEFFKANMIECVTENNYKITYNFRCPLCGDSQSNRRKKRGYLLFASHKKDGFNFYCHNCGESLPFDGFLKRLLDFGLVFYNLWGKTLDIEKIKEQEVDPTDLSLYIPLQYHIDDYVKSIEDNKRVHAYVTDRLIPKKYYNTKLFSYSGSIYDFVRKKPIFGDMKFTDASFIPNDYLVLVNEIFYNGTIIPAGFTLRTLMGTSRYFKIPMRIPTDYFFSNVIDSDAELDTVLVLEGQIDTLMFEMPAFSFEGSNLSKVNEYREFKGSNKIFIYDNDYRQNPFILAKAKKLSDKDYMVVWHLDKKNKFKDPNAMIMGGYKFPLDSYIKPLIKTGLEKFLYMKTAKKGELPQYKKPWLNKLGVNK